MSERNPFESLDGFNNPVVKAESDKADAGLKHLAHEVKIADVREKTAYALGQIDLALGLGVIIAPSPIHEALSAAKFALEELAQMVGIEV